MADVGFWLTWFFISPRQRFLFFHCQQGCWKYPSYLFSLSIGFSIRNKATFIPSLLGLPPAICSYSLHHRHYSFPWAAKSEFCSFLVIFFTFINECQRRKGKGTTCLTFLITRTCCTDCFTVCEPVKKDFSVLSGVKMCCTVICSLCRRYSVT